MEPLIGELSHPTDAVIDGSTETFADDVLAASKTVPVIVDFWAEWCGPCKTLGPVLEKVVKHSGGAVKLVKIDVDKNQELAAQMRIQSIPAVYAFKDGRPVDGFAGALPESQIKQFVQRLTGGEGSNKIEEALAIANEAFEAGDWDQAAGIYIQIVQADPENGEAAGGYLHCLIKQDKLEEAQQTLDGFEGALAQHAAVSSARAALELANQAEEIPSDITPLQQKVDADPADHQARIDLANALVAAGEKEAGLDQLLESIRRDRQWNDEAARKQLLKYFEAFGFTDPLTIAARRKLSSMLFS